MAETSGFWTTSNTPSGHQVSGYTQAHHSKSLQIAAGVGKQEGVAVNYLNELAPSVTAANTVSVESGGALVDGKWYENNAPVAVNIPSSAAGTTRIDRLVVRANWSAFTGTITRIAGTDSGTPVAPALQRSSGTTYDIPICQALVNASGQVTITDERAMDYQGLSIVALGNSANLKVGDDAFTFPIPETLNGLRVVRGDISVYTPSSSGSIIVQAALDGTDIFSTRPAIAVNNYNSSDAGGTRGVSSAVLRTGQRLRIDVDGAGTGAKGLTLHLVLK
jgi:hypothetical protein